VWDDLIFLTSQAGHGPLDPSSQGFEASRAARRAQEGAGVEFYIQAFSRPDGRVAWQHRFPAEGPLPAVHTAHNFATPSCVTGGERVYALMGDGQVLALDRKGKVLWQRHLGREIRPFDVAWGHGSSPVLYRDTLLVLSENPAGAFLLALDQRTGQTRWKADRGNRRSYTTPLVIAGPRGDELLINTSNRLEALDPANGALLWHAGEANQVPVAMPVFHEGVIYTTRGYFSGPYMAVRAGGRGDVDESHVLWEVKTGAPYVGSMLYYQGMLYMATERGIATAIDPQTGATIWRERLGGCFLSSPVGAAGRVYLFNEDGEGIVLAAARQFQVLARNRLEERVVASPAVAGGCLLVRTDEHLYSIGGRV
jgi:outer membrane protein assembly factor BamB